MSPEERQLFERALKRIRELQSERGAAASREPIAIVGAGCRFPGGVRSYEDYGRFLRDGVHASGPAPARLADSSTNLRGSFLDEVETFDADFFGIAPREAAYLDPQQRLLLEVAWEAFEHAGIAADHLSGTSTGVYVGLMNGDYALRHAAERGARAVDAYAMTGNEASFAAGRLAYFFGLQGPALVVSTACSSSLVTVHLAAQALRAGECDLALAGGSNVILEPHTFATLTDSGAAARDGRCKTFDASADGYGRGEGCGIVVLERLADAQRNGRTILAVIRGSAMNHDGPSAGLTVPNGAAQEKLLRRALAAADVAPSAVGYVEAHGTGTALGDPIEVEALARVFGEGRTAPLLVGSVKTNFGHLEAAAGVAGLLKTALALREGIVPPHLHVQTPNPHVDWNRLPIEIATSTRRFTSDGPRVAGVSSFGLSGTNAHVVLAEPPPLPARERELARVRLLALSARTDTALHAKRIAMAEHLASHPDVDWGDVCFTANTGRVHFARRFCVVASTTDEACAQLRGEVAPPFEATAAAYVAGAEIDWAAHHRDEAPRRRRMALPSYPFERERHWVLERGAGVAHAAEVAASTPSELVVKVLGIAEPLRADRPLIDLGLDSLMAAEIRTWFARERNIDVDLRHLLSTATLADLNNLNQSPLPIAASPRWGEGQYEGPSLAQGRTALSYGQRALWFLHAAAPESAAYNVALAFRLRGAIDRDRLAYAVDAVIARHAALRTSFRLDGDEPVQDIHATCAADFRIVDEGDLTHESRVPFDLARAPLFRVRVIGDALLLVFHHIICDAISCWTILADLQRAYAGEKLAPPRGNYADFVRTEAEMLAGEEGERLWAYWRAQLEGELPQLDVPTDFRRPAVQRFEGDALTFTIDADLTSRVRALARGANATLFSTLLAAFQLLLHRYSGQDDVIVGVATSARPAGLEDVAGYFVNPVPIRARFEDDPSFSSLLANVQRTTFDALDHQQFPFPLLVQRLHPRRDPARPPVFQADFALSKAATSYRARVNGALPVEPLALAEELGQFELGLHVLDRDDVLAATLKYDSNLFRRDTIERMAASLRTLLESVAADPSRASSAVPLLDDAERLRILRLGEGPRHELPSSLVHELIAAHAVTTPDAIAVESGGTKLTFLELDQRANALAALLQERGVTTESLVAVCLPRSCDLIVAMLAVLKAGGAYVPLDPSYPDERLQLLVRDARPTVVIATPTLASRLDIEAIDPNPASLPLSATKLAEQTDRRRPAGWTGGVRAALRLGGEDAAEPAGEDAGGPLVLSRVDNLAYVIYTSGSTGTPKGTLVTHGAFLNYVAWAADFYRAADGNGAPVQSSVGFDATITSIYAPLVSGRRVVLLPEEAPVEALCDLLRAEGGFSLLKITPAHLDMLAELMRPEELRGRARSIVIGGEALRGEALAPWLAHAPETRLFNEYGPTETVVGCSVFEITSSIEGSVPIGRAIANTRLYVLDAHGQPVPMGVVGELSIGGAGVARGYLDRDELTAARFVRDPFDANARLYRTGDRARFLADGTLEYRGRTDDQEKIRGFRVEPAEVESILAQHPGVDACAVAARDDGNGGRVLIAWIVAPAKESSELAARTSLQFAVRGLQERDNDVVVSSLRTANCEPRTPCELRAPSPLLAPAELRAHLAKKLPPPMIPSFFVFLDALPLTAHGKVDRKALPAPASARPSTSLVAPRSALEMQLVAIWEDVLGVHPVGIRDDFFDLGGHSLLAVRLVSRIAAAVGREVPVATILQAPTIERLAATLSAAGGTRGRALVPMTTRGDRPPLFCAPGAGGNAIYLYSLARHLPDDQPFYGLQAAGVDGETAPHATIEEMAAYAVDAIREVQPHGPYFVGGHSLGGWIAYEIAQQLIRAGEEIGLLFVIDTPSPHHRDTTDRRAWDDAQWIADLSYRVAELLDPSAALDAEELRALDAHARRLAFRDALVRADLYPADGGLGVLERILNLFRAHAQVVYDVPRDPAPLPIALLRTAAPLQHQDVPTGDATWGWSALGHVDVAIVPGEHLSVLRVPYVAALARALATRVTQAKKGERWALPRS